MLHQYESSLMKHGSSNIGKVWILPGRHLSGGEKEIQKSMLDKEGWEIIKPFLICT